MLSIYLDLCRMLVSHIFSWLSRRKKSEFPEIPHGDDPTGEKLTRVMDRSREPQCLAGVCKISDFVVYTVVSKWFCQWYMP